VIKVVEHSEGKTMSSFGDTSTTVQFGDKHSRRSHRQTAHKQAVPAESAVHTYAASAVPMHAADKTYSSELQAAAAQHAAVRAAVHKWLVVGDLPLPIAATALHSSAADRHDKQEQKTLSVRSTTVSRRGIGGATDSATSKADLLAHVRTFEHSCIDRLLTLMQRRRDEADVYELIEAFCRVCTNLGTFRLEYAGTHILYSSQ
jgi:hypothetical protein